MGHRAPRPDASRSAGGEGLGATRRRALRWAAQAGGHCPDAAQRCRAATAGRADQPSRRGHRRLAGRRARRAAHLAGAGDARPVLPGQPGGPDRGDPAGPRTGLLPRKLPGVPRSEARRGGRRRAGSAQARTVDCPGGRLAPEGPRGAADEEPCPGRPCASADGRAQVRPAARAGAADGRGAEVEPHRPGDEGRLVLLRHPPSAEGGLADHPVGRPGGNRRDRTVRGRRPWSGSSSGS